MSTFVWVMTPSVVVTDHHVCLLPLSRVEYRVVPGPCGEWELWRRKLENRDWHWVADWPTSAQARADAEDRERGKS